MVDFFYKNLIIIFFIKQNPPPKIKYYEPTKTIFLLKTPLFEVNDNQ